MNNYHVIDTNVLIVASSAAPAVDRTIESTPSEPALRQKVFRWLEEFDRSPKRLVLDTNLEIWGEYQKKLTVQDYGIQVVMNKWSTDAIDNVTVDYDLDRHAILPAGLNVHDPADRKFVAAALKSIEIFGEVNIAFSSDSDWYDWEDELKKNGIVLEPIIHEWSFAKYLEKMNR